MITSVVKRSAGEGVRNESSDDSLRSALIGRFFFAHFQTRDEKNKINKINYLNYVIIILY